MGFQRTAIVDFTLHNPIYANAWVTAYRVDENFVKTSELVPLYQATTGDEQHPNPWQLDSEGKWQAPVYIEEPVILDVSGAGFTGSHETGVIAPRFDPADLLLPGTDNLLRNGDLERWTHGTNINFSGFLADGWRYTSNGAGGTHSRQNFAVGQTDVPYGPNFFSRIQYTVAPAGDVLYTQYLPDVRKFSGEPFTFSFSAQGTADLPVTVRMSQVFGAGGGASPSVHLDQEITLAAAWARHELTFDLPLIAGATIDGESYAQVQFRLPVQAFVFDVAKLKLQRGVEATPPVPRPPWLDALHCRRFFRRYQTQQNVQDLAYEMHKQPVESGTGPFDYDAEVQFL